MYDPTIRNSFPMFAWGLPEDYTQWANIGAPITTLHQPDLFGGTGSVHLQGSSSAQQLFTGVPTFKRPGQQSYSIFMQSGSGQTSVTIFDINTNTMGVSFNVNWTNFVPSASISGGTGSMFTPLPFGNGWYWFRVSMTSASIADIYHYGIFPAGNNTTGSVTVFNRNVVIAGGPLYQDSSDEQDRPSFTRVQMDSGYEDVWILPSVDARLIGTVTKIRAWDNQIGYPASGFYGNNEGVGLNAGWKAMVTAGRHAQLIDYAPDYRRVSDYYVSGSYLYDPMTDGFQLAQDNTLDLNIKLRNPNAVEYLGHTTL